MAKFRFSLIAGCLYRSQVRVELQRSVDTLMYEYPGSNATVKEYKGFLESEFAVQGTGFPDTDEFVSRIKNWERKIIECQD